MPFQTLSFITSKIIILSDPSFFPNLENVPRLAIRPRASSSCILACINIESHSGSRPTETRREGEREKDREGERWFNCHARFDPIFHRVSAVLMFPRSEYAHPCFEVHRPCARTRAGFFVSATIWSQSTREPPRCMRSREHRAAATAVHRG